MPSDVRFVEDTDGVTDPKGFFAAAASADVRDKQDGRLDAGIVYSPSPCAAAGVFTKNAVKAAPVLDCERILDLGTPIHGIIANSGNANACTGTQGLKDSLEMIRRVPAIIEAPISQGQPIAEIVVSLDGENMATEQLRALDNNPEGSLWQRARDGVSLWFE